MEVKFRYELTNRMGCNLYEALREEDFDRIIEGETEYYREQSQVGCEIRKPLEIAVGAGSGCETAAWVTWGADCGWEYLVLEVLEQPAVSVRYQANIGRQMFYRADVGHPKASVLVTRINQCTGFSWEAAPIGWIVAIAEARGRRSSGPCGR